MSGSYKVQVKRIEFQMVEGTTGSLFLAKRTFASFAEVNAWIARIRHSDEAPTSGYNKCDFTITFEDGETYSGRYDLSKNPRSDEATLDAHVREHNLFYSGRKRPAHMTEENYKNLLNDKWHRENKVAESAAYFLDHYEV